MKNDDKIALAAEIAMFAMSTECAAPIPLGSDFDSAEIRFKKLDALIKSVYKTLDDLEEK